MDQQTPLLDIQEWTTPEGQLVRVAYDAEADLLEVIFSGTEADDSVDLTEDITFHFNAAQGRATGITFVSFRQLKQAGEWGAPSYPLTRLSRLPAALQASVIRMLNASPTNQFLRTVTLIGPKNKTQPILTVDSPMPIAV